MDGSDRADNFPDSGGSFRFPVAIEREQLQAVYRDGLLTVTAPKANKVSTVTVKVEG